MVVGIQHSDIVDSAGGSQEEENPLASDYTSTVHNLQLRIAELGRVIELQPQGADLFADRGGLYLDLGEILHENGDYESSVPNLEDAIEDYNQALRLKPELGYSYADRGLAHTLLGNDVEALRDLQKAVELGADRSSLEQEMQQDKGQAIAARVPRGRFHRQKSEYNAPPTTCWGTLQIRKSGRPSGIRTLDTRIKSPVL